MTGSQRGLEEDSEQQNKTVGDILDIRMEYCVQKVVQILGEGDIYTKEERREIRISECRNSHSLAD